MMDDGRSPAPPFPQPPPRPAPPPAVAAPSAPPLQWVGAVVQSNGRGQLNRRPPRRLGAGVEPPSPRSPHNPAQPPPYCALGCHRRQSATTRTTPQHYATAAADAAAVAAATTTAVGRRASCIDAAPMPGRGLLPPPRPTLLRPRPAVCRTPRRPPSRCTGRGSLAPPHHNIGPHPAPHTPL